MRRNLLKKMKHLEINIGLESRNDATAKRERVLVAGTVALWNSGWVCTAKGVDIRWSISKYHITNITKNTILCYNCWDQKRRYLPTIIFEDHLANLGFEVDTSGMLFASPIKFSPPLLNVINLISLISSSSKTLQTILTSIHFY